MAPLNVRKRLVAGKVSLNGIDHLYLELLQPPTARQKTINDLLAK